MAHMVEPHIEPEVRYSYRNAGKSDTVRKIRLTIWLGSGSKTNSRTWADLGRLVGLGRHRGPCSRGVRHLRSLTNPTNLGNRA